MEIKTLNNIKLEILFCKVHKLHYDTKNGCSFCPSIETKLREQLAFWKDAYFEQREATGKNYWDGFAHGWKHGITTADQPLEAFYGITISK